MKFVEKTFCEQVFRDLKNSSSKKSYRRFLKTQHLLFFKITRKENCVQRSSFHHFPISYSFQYVHHKNSSRCIFLYRVVNLYSFIVFSFTFSTFLLRLSFFSTPSSRSLSTTNFRISKQFSYY